MSRQIQGPVDGKLLEPKAYFCKVPVHIYSLHAHYGDFFVALWPVGLAWVKPVFLGGTFANQMTRSDR